MSAKPDTVSIQYFGAQPLMFFAGRKVGKDEIGNPVVHDEGRLISLIPSSELPRTEQIQTVSKADWESLKKEKTAGAVIAHLMAQHEIIVHG